MNQSSQYDAISFVLQEVQLLQTEILINEAFFSESEEKLKAAKNKNLLSYLLESVIQKSVQINLLNRIKIISARIDTCENLLNKLGVNTKK